MHFSSGDGQLAGGRSTLLLLAVGMLLHAAAADAASIRLAWDPSRTAGVIGYRVYVGTASRAYTEIHDVGQATWFSYEGSPGRRYYFAVASYLPGPVEGPLSEEVSGYATETPPPSSRVLTDELVGVAAGDPDPAPAPSGRSVCAELPARDCTEHIATVAGDASAPTPTGDGRLFFIESGKYVRVIAGDTLLPGAALAAEAGARLTGLALDPMFDRTRLVYVGEVEARAGGVRELNIVRYREVANVLAERAAIVTGLPLPREGDAPFTIDAARRLYVAVPAPLDGSGPASVYGGMVLRFESDGRVSHDSRAGSPVHARGYAQPAAVVWSSARNELWLAGAGAEWPASLARLALDTDAPEWPRVPRGVHLETDVAVASLFSVAGPARASSALDEAGGHLILVDQDGVLLWITVQAAGVASTALLAGAALGGDVTSAALDGDDIYVVLRNGANRFVVRRTLLAR